MYRHAQLRFLLSACLAAGAGIASAQQTAGLTAPGTNQYPNLGYRHVGSLTAQQGIPFGWGDIHPDGGIAYFGSNDYLQVSGDPATVYKVDLHDFRILDAVTLELEEDIVTHIRIHANRLYAGIGSDSGVVNHLIGKIVKFDADTLGRVAELDFPFYIRRFEIDPAGTMLMWDGVDNVYTVDVDEFTAIRRKEIWHYGLVMDPAGGAFYYQKNHYEFVRVDLETLETLEILPTPRMGLFSHGMVIEGTTSIWGGSDHNLVQFNIKPFSYGGYVQVPVGGWGGVYPLGYDPTRKLVFAQATDTEWAELRLLTHSPLVLAGKLPLYGNYASPGIHDPVTKANYFPAMGLPGQLLKVTSARDQSLNATRIDLPEPATIQEMRFYTHVAEGNIRFALYNDAKPKSLLWQSPEIPNTVEEGEIIVPIADGEPPALNLAAGTYWAAFQIDTRADVPSYTPGGEGEGWIAPYRFGPAPLHVHDGPTTTTLPFVPTISAVSDDGLTTQTERWTQYVTYLQHSGVDQWVVE